MRIHNILVSLLLIACSGSDGQTSNPASVHVDANAVDLYKQLNHQIFGQREDEGSGQIYSMKTRDLEIRGELHELISSQIISILNRNEGSATEVPAAIKTLQGKFAMWSRGTNTPLSQDVEVTGIPTSAVAYVTMEGGEGIPATQPYLEFYDRLYGEWRLAASSSSREDFEGCTFNVARMNSGVPGQIWFLAWGVTIGDTGSRLKLRLYAYDGSGVRTVTRRDGLIRGLITVSKDSVQLEYDETYEPLGDPQKGHETLHITPNGLQ